MRTDEQIRIAKIKDVTEMKERVIIIPAESSYWQDDFQDELEVITNEWYEFADYFDHNAQVDYKTNALEILNGIIAWEVTMEVGEPHVDNSLLPFSGWVALLELDETGQTAMRKVLLESTKKSLFDTYANRTVITDKSPLDAIMSVKPERSDEDWMDVLNLSIVENETIDVTVHRAFKSMMQEIVELSEHGKK